MPETFPSINHRTASSHSHSHSHSLSHSPTPPNMRRHDIHESTKREIVTERLDLMHNTGYTQKQQMNPIRRLFIFYGLPKFSEYFISVDHHSIWRRHLAWSLRDGGEFCDQDLENIDHLRNAVTSRFASNMVFMSLLLGTEIGVLFSPSKPADAFRYALKNAVYTDINFWAAIILCISIGMTLSTLVANFTAWAIIGSVSPQNSHAILRSSIGLYAAQLPARLVVLSIYSNLAWLVLMLFTLLPSVWCFVIGLFPVALIGHIVCVYSAFGRLVMYSKAMRREEIFQHDEEDAMTPPRLFEALLLKARNEKKRNTPLPLYYKSKNEIRHQIRQMKSDPEMVENGFDSVHASNYLDKILNRDSEGGVGDMGSVPDLNHDEEDMMSSVPQSPGMIASNY